ncbi:unnamed protein product [Oreochromis niloticus]|nr:unnamed protein product [Mustela putorius furo]
MADTVGPSLQRKGDHLANQDTCLAAVRALRQIIQTSGTLLKDDIHKRLHEVVLPLCVRLRSSSSLAAAMHVNLQGVRVGSTAVLLLDENCTGYCWPWSWSPHPVGLHL